MARKITLHKKRPSRHSLTLRHYLTLYKEETVLNVRNNGYIVTIYQEDHNYIKYHEEYTVIFSYSYSYTFSDTYFWSPYYLQRLDLEKTSLMSVGSNHSQIHAVFQVRYYLRFTFLNLRSWVAFLFSYALVLVYVVSKVYQLQVLCLYTNYRLCLWYLVNALIGYS